MAATYDVFLSYTWADRDAVERLAQALRDHGLAVFVDDPEIDDFARITTTITQALANATVLLVYYSAAYPTRRACQWELTAAYLAASRAGDPGRRILVINPEPTPDHLHPGELRDALFRHAPDDQAALNELAQAVADHVHGLTGPLGQVAPLTPARWLPTQGLGSTRFVGRLPEMWQLHSALHPATTQLTVGHTGPAVAQVRGLGGIGKSLLAEEYALRFGAAYPGGVFWLRAYGSHDQSDLPGEELDARRHDEVRRLADLLGVQTGQLTPDQVTGAVAQRIQEADKPCLWVVDDLPEGLDAQQVRAWLAPHPLAATLFTTRSKAYGALAAVIELDVLAEQDAVELLTSRRLPTSEDETQAAHGIVEALGLHALAVDVAGAALATQQGLVSYADFRWNLAESDEDELELVAELADALPNGHEASITRTLLRSVNQLAEEGRDFLRLAASLAPTPIPAELIAAVLAQADTLDATQATRRAGHAVAQAAGLSLATKAAADDEGAAWLVHALVTRTVRFQEPAPQRAAALRAAAIAVLTGRLRAIVDARAYVGLQVVVPHARELVGHVDTTAEADLLGWVARYDVERGDFRPAETLYRQQLDARQRLLDPDHPDILQSMNNLATTLHDLGDLPAARDLHQQALNIAQRVLGPDHPDTLASMDNLAEAVRALEDDPAAAADLHQRVLDARRQRLGRNHPDTLGSMNHLAEALYDLGELLEARDLHLQALDTARQVLGPDHRNTLTSMNNLAKTLQALRDFAAARDLHRQAFDARRQVLGPDHPDTLQSMNNLAVALRDLGDLLAAKQLLEQVVNAFKQRLGPDHPTTLSSMNNLAATLQDLGDLPAAQQLLEQVASGFKQRLGRNHPNTRQAMANLAIVVHAQRPPG
jgi:tetratricopeptide (TPR) repeat protein